MCKYYNLLAISLRMTLMMIITIFFAQPSFADDNLKNNQINIGFTFKTDFSIFQPELLSLSFNSEIDGQIFVPLVYQQPDGTIIPGAAISWDTNKEKTSVIFHLDPRLRWRNGDPLTAHDFVFTFEKLAYHRISHLTGLVNIIGWDDWSRGNTNADFGATALNDHELKIDFTESAAINLFQLQSIYATKQAGSETLEAPFLPWSKTDNWGSYGAYKVEKITPNAIILKKNNYFPEEKKVEVSSIKYVSAEERVWLEKYINGGFSAMIGSIGNQKRWLKEYRKEDLQKVGMPILYFMAPNLQLEKFKKPNLLKALYFALDRERFGKQQFGSSYKPIVGNVPDVFSNYRPPEPSDVGYASELLLAKYYMSKLGYDENNHLKLKVGVVNDIPGYSEIAGFTVGSWKSIYVDMEIVNVASFMDMIQQFKAGKFDLTIASFTGNYANPVSYLELPNEFLNLAEIKLDDKYYKVLKNINLAHNQIMYQNEIAKLDKYVSDEKLIFPIAVDDSTVLIQSPLNHDGSATTMVAPKILVEKLKIKSTLMVDVNYFE